MKWDPLRGHVLQYVNQPAKCPLDRVFRERVAGRLGEVKVDDLGEGFVVVERNQHLWELDVVVNDPLLTGVLDRLADRHEPFQPLRFEIVVQADE